MTRVPEKVSDSEGRRSNSNSSSPAHFVLGRRRTGSGNIPCQFHARSIKENYIALYDADGKTLIDEIDNPASQKADVSYGRTLDGQGEWTVLTKVTPSTNNVTLDSNEKIENFKENDSWGIGMTLTAMAVVFSGLFLLFIIFKQIGKLSIAASKRNAQKAAGAAVIADNAGQESGEIFAAIGAALYEMSDDNHRHRTYGSDDPQGSKILFSVEFQDLRSA